MKRLLIIAAASLLLWSTPATGQDPGECFDCQDWNGMHRVVSAPDALLGDMAETEHGWYGGSCNLQHPCCVECQPGDDSASEILPPLTTLSALSEADPEFLADVLSKHDGRLSVNVARRSLQATDCQGGIIANIPLHDRQLAALVERQRSGQVVVEK